MLSKQLEAMQLVQQCDCSCVSLSQTMQNADYVYSLFVFLVKWGLTITQGRNALPSKVSPPPFKKILAGLHWALWATQFAAVRHAIGLCLGFAAADLEPICGEAIGLV